LPLAFARLRAKVPLLLSRPIPFAFASFALVPSFAFDCSTFAFDYATQRQKTQRQKGRTFSLPPLLLATGHKAQKAKGKGKSRPTQARVPCFFCLCVAFCLCGCEVKSKGKSKAKVLSQKHRDSKKQRKA